MSDTDKQQILNFIKEIARKTGIDFSDNQLLMNMPINTFMEVMQRSIDDIVTNDPHAETNEGQSLIKRSAHGQPVKSPPDIHKMREEQMQQYIDAVRAGIISQEDAAKQMGLFPFDEELINETSTTESILDEETMKKEIDKLSSELEDLEKIKEKGETYREIIACEHYAMLTHNPRVKQFHLFKDTRKKLCRKYGIIDSHYKDIKKEIHNMDFRKLEDLVNESKYKHFFELVG